MVSMPTISLRSMMIELMHDMMHLFCTPSPWKA